jgi:hypothetical protein
MLCACFCAETCAFDTGCLPRRDVLWAFTWHAFNDPSVLTNTSYFFQVIERMVLSSTPLMYVSCKCVCLHPIVVNLQVKHLWEPGKPARSTRLLPCWCRAPQAHADNHDFYPQYFTLGAHAHAHAHGSIVDALTLHGHTTRQSSWSSPCTWAPCLS